MSPEKQRIKIAEACKWEPQTICTDFIGTPWPDSPPDYLNDLNAIHEAIKSLDQGRHYLYIVQLKGALGSIDAVDATAAQRAEAFLKALVLWEDGE